MSNDPSDPLDSVNAWLSAQRKVALATVTRTWGSAPRPVGAMVAIRGDGQVMGSVSGGCVEDDLIDKVKTQAVAATKPEVVTYGVTQEQATRYGLPCGGTLQLVLEPVGENSHLDQLLAAIERHELVARTLNMDSGIANIQPGRWSDVLEFDGKALKTVHGPRWRLLVIGAGQVSRYLAQMAQALWLRLTEKQGLILAHLCLDLRVVRQHIAANFLMTDDQFGGLALGAGVVSTIFSNHARRCSGNLGAQVLGIAWGMNRHELRHQPVG